MAASGAIVIVGCGRLGARLAGDLDRRGWRVVIVDRDEAAFSALSPEYGGRRLVGEPPDIAALERAGIEEADVLVAATHKDDLNLAVAAVARRAFGVRRVVARVADPVRAERGAEGVEAVCPTALAAAAISRMVEDAPRP